MNSTIKHKVKAFPVINRLVCAKKLYPYYRNHDKTIDEKRFILENYHKCKLIGLQDDKNKQIIELIKHVHFIPVESNCFFYSIDPFVSLDYKSQVFQNYSIDYDWVVNSCFDEVFSKLTKSQQFMQEYQEIINALKDYTERLRKNDKLKSIYNANIEEIDSLFSRPSKHFHEAVQRILFVNQWLWQSGHKHNGLGHLDWLLFDLYQNDIDTGYITKDIAREYIKELFFILHDKCWYKSSLLVGDTGQIIILGGKTKDSYKFNELTFMFIEVAKELKLPDPKVLLRVSDNMSRDLLRLSVECIATGIGAPLLSNDDIIIDKLIKFGYDEDDAYNYVTSACWEPLIAGKSCDLNNIRTLNLVQPFVDFADSDEFDNCREYDDLKKQYYRYLEKYTNDFLDKLDILVYEEDPFLTLFSPESLTRCKDLVRGGAKYANMGITTVGMSNVVNSLLNIKKFVYDDEKYSLDFLNDQRKRNYNDDPMLLQLLSRNEYRFGSDDEAVINLTNDIMHFISSVFMTHKTQLGGQYKYGLSSPNYIVDSMDISATFDGRRAGQPFGVHISGSSGTSPTELISFSSKLDYDNDRFNGNVVDFILNPKYIDENAEKVVDLIIGAIKEGFFQCQINVVNSKILIDAQKNPEKYSNLVVRVWGFSAYFNDLPKEYQDNLIRRTIDAEKTA